MVGQYYLERYYARGSQRSLPPTPLEKLRMRLGGMRPPPTRPQPVPMPGGQRGEVAGGGGIVGGIGDGA
jgi:polar amino acid transport system permease protein